MYVTLTLNPCTSPAGLSLVVENTLKLSEELALLFLPLHAHLEPVWVAFRSFKCPLASIYNCYLREG